MPTMMLSVMISIDLLSTLQFYELQNLEEPNCLFQNCFSMTTMYVKGKVVRGEIIWIRFVVLGKCC